MDPFQVTKNDVRLAWARVPSRWRACAHSTKRHSAKDTSAPAAENPADVASNDTGRSRSLEDGLLKALSKSFAQIVKPRRLHASDARTTTSGAEIPRVWKHARPCCLSPFRCAGSPNHFESQKSRRCRPVHERTGNTDSGSRQHRTTELPCSQACLLTAPQERPKEVTAQLSSGSYPMSEENDRQ